MNEIVYVYMVIAAFFYLAYATRGTFEVVNEITGETVKHADIFLINAIGILVGLFWPITLLTIKRTGKK